jgi:phenylpropionate dioxygenase-like ring-hydroxylating dioxygenase large terminal subunit
MRFDPEAIRSLVHRDHVHRSLYLDPEVFDLEMTKIFGRTWVYVGHDSLVPKIGDYVTTRVGNQPVVLSRHDDGKIHVIYNSCGHRGAIVCNEDKGNARLFRCCYHGWTFKTNGDLDAVAMPRGYGKQFDLTDPSLGMGRLPRVAVYRGFVFASLSPRGPGLEEYLGHARDSIDELVDRAPEGEIDLSAGVHKYMFRGNWKLQLENVVDMYHVPFSHESTVARGGRQFGRRAGENSGSAISDRGNAAQRWEQRSAWGSRSNGHSYNGHQPIAEQLPDDPVFKSYLASLEARHGAERTREILRPKRHNTAFYPNMTLQALNQHVRVIVPVAVDRTEVHVYPIKLKGAPEEMNRSFVRHLNITHSAASLIQTDDLECFRRCQTGLPAHGSEWVWFARGVETDQEDERGDYVNNGTVEIQQRAQYAAWLRLMSAEEWE